MRTKASWLLLVAFVLLAAPPAFAAWDFKSVFTLSPVPDGRIYDQCGYGFVKDGAFVQFIVGIGGAPIVDPHEYFGNLDSGDGVINTPYELWACTTWVRGGADPAAISNGQNVLCHNAVGTFTGEFETTDGNVNWDYLDPPWGPGLPPPLVQYGLGGDLIATRVWNKTKEEVEGFGINSWWDVWYMTDREFGSQSTGDTGWTVGMGSVPVGGDPVAYGWGFQGTVGVEVALGTRPFNMLDTYLIEWLPAEPGTFVVGACGLLLLLFRRRRSS
jgi:hypothetical protein